MKQASAVVESSPCILRDSVEYGGGLFSEKESGIWEGSDGTTYIIIGRLSTDAQLEKIARRTDASFEELRAFRGIHERQHLT